MVTGNTGAGLSFQAGAGSTINIPSFVDNELGSNGGAGVELVGATGSTIEGDFQRNSFSGNQGGGLIASSDSGKLDLTIGGSTVFGTPRFPVNQFTGNAGAGIGVLLSGSATAEFDITDNTITGTTDNAASTILNGERDRGSPGRHQHHGDPAFYRHGWSFEHHG